jgi:glutaredoxin
MVLYTQESCGPCKIVKNFLVEKGIDFEECDVNKDAKFWCYWNVISRKLGVKRTTPLLVDGDKEVATSMKILDYLKIKNVDRETVDKESCDSCQ